MKRTPLKRKPLKRNKSSPKESKNLFPVKTSKEDEWAEIREELKGRFKKAGIIACELGYDGCIRSYNFGFKWTFAHSLKRGQIIAEKIDAEQRRVQLEEVIYVCQECHAKIEKLGNRNDEMYNIVIAVIRQRKIQP